MRLWLLVVGAGAEHDVLHADAEAEAVEEEVRHLEVALLDVDVVRLGVGSQGAVGALVEAAVLELDDAQVLAVLEKMVKQRRARCRPGPGGRRRRTG